MLVLCAQIYQSVLTAYVAYTVTMLQDNILDVFMNFAAIIVIAQLDDTLGDWWRTNLTPFRGDMKIDLNALYNYASTMLITAMAKYVTWSFSAVITGTFLYSYLGT